MLASRLLHSLLTSTWYTLQNLHPSLPAPFLPCTPLRPWKIRPPSPFHFSLLSRESLGGLELTFSFHPQGSCFGSFTASVSFRQLPPFFLQLPLGGREEPSWVYAVIQNAVIFLKVILVIF